MPRSPFDARSRFALLRLVSIREYGKMVVSWAARAPPRRLGAAPSRTAPRGLQLHCPSSGKTRSPLDTSALKSPHFQQVTCLHQLRSSSASQHPYVGAACGHSMCLALQPHWAPSLQAGWKINETAWSSHDNHDCSTFQR